MVESIHGPEQEAQLKDSHRPGDRISARRPSMAIRVKVSSKYQISVPSVARRKLPIMPGDYLLLDVRDGYVILMPEPRDYGQHLTGLHREIWEGVDPQEYLRREREAAQE